MAVIPELLPHERRVREMMTLFGQAVPSSPEVPPLDVRVLRARLLLEEVLEYIEAAGLALWSHHDGSMQPFTMETAVITSSGSPDLVAMTDALADITVVTTGAFAAQGTRMAPILECVDANNIAKYARGRKDEHGKFIKAENHPKPDIATMLRLQTPTKEEE